MNLMVYHSVCSVYNSSFEVRYGMLSGSSFRLAQQFSEFSVHTRIGSESIRLIAFNSRDQPAARTLAKRSKSGAQSSADRPAANAKAKAKAVP
jgi:hypothetical protein